jgi:hypothetical protein
LLKDPYRFDFLGLTNEAQEREIEHALVRHVTEFLLELGASFAFVGRQMLLNVGGDEFFINLLFYHLKLRCYVVVELKSGKFKPEHLGQLGFYLTVVDRQVKGENDNPSIGLLLCKTKNKIVAEYALGDKTLVCIHATFRFAVEELGVQAFDGRLIAVAKVLDPALKTIVHIPNVNSRESPQDKEREVNDGQRGWHRIDLE